MSQTLFVGFPHLHIVMKHVDITDKHSLRVTVHMARISKHQRDWTTVLVKILHMLLAVLCTAPSECSEFRTVVYGNGGKLRYINIFTLFTGR